MNQKQTQIYKMVKKMHKTRGHRDYNYVPPVPDAGGGGGGGGATSRNSLLWPFDSHTSPWNVPIGANAVFKAASFGIDPQSGGFVPFPFHDPIRIITSFGSPQIQLQYSSAGWSGSNRCASTGSGSGFPRTIPVPTSYLVPNSNGNECAAIILPDGVTVLECEPFTRCSAGGIATSIVTTVVSGDVGIGADKNTKTSDGIRGSHGGASMSGFGGCLRLGELRPGSSGPTHALNGNMWGGYRFFQATNNTNGHRWPAFAQDSGSVGSGGNGYGYVSGAPNATNTSCVIGMLLAIPSTTNITTMGLQTVPGQQIAWTMQNYGMYITDNTAGAGFYFSTEEGAQGSFVNQFSSDYGFAFDQRTNGSNTTATNWSADILKILQACKIVDNNAPATIGGGGTPLQPYAPDVFTN